VGDAGARQEGTWGSATRRTCGCADGQGRHASARRGAAGAVVVGAASERRPVSEKLTALSHRSSTLDHEPLSFYVPRSPVRLPCHVTP